MSGAEVGALGPAEGGPAPYGVALTSVGFYSTFVAETEPPIVLAHPDPAPAASASAIPALLGLTPPQVALTAAPTSAKTPAAVSKPVLRQGVWLEIPALAIALPLERGQMGQPVPYWRALVYPGTAWPGQPGNSYVYAHGIWGEFGGLL